MSESEGGAERERVVAVTDEEVAAIRAGDIRRYLAILSDDAVFLPPNSPPIKGDDLREWLRDFVQRFVVEWLDFVHGETIVISDLAYHDYAYSWRVTPKAGGEPSVSHGKGLHVVRRQPDGVWKLVRNIWNARPAPLGAR